MAKKKIFLSLRYLKRALINNGASQVAEKGLHQFAEQLQNEAKEIITVANSIAKSEKRITLSGTDYEGAIGTLGRKNNHNPMKDKYGFSILSIKKLQEHDGVARTSETGIATLKKYLEQIVDLIAYDAVRLANNGGRMRITDQDINLAFDVYFKR